MKNNLSYLTEKILNAKIETDPFDHIYIEDFFSEEHFNEIVNLDQIKLRDVNDDVDLLNTLEEVGYVAISFPGCIQDKDEYLNWHKDKKTSHIASSSNEGFGMVFRLKNIQSQLLLDIDKFIRGEEFNKAVAERFNVKYSDCIIDAGIQKYLDGYEISPHPDVRRKATTFMVNINPSDYSETADHHTHYMKFKEDYIAIKEYWDSSGTDRAWVPWEWCDTYKMQTKNNSIVLFSPANDTLHGVKATYNHLLTQRTQLYGNMW